MKKLFIIACLALSCATEPPPLTTPDPCLGLGWIEQYELDCGPGIFYCTPKLQKDVTDCKLLCDFRTYPINWVEANPQWTYLKIQNNDTVNSMICLLR